MVSRRVLVTGATGYIGGRLVPRAARRRHQVRCLARDPGSSSDEPWTERVEVVRGDVTDARVGRARPWTASTPRYYLVHSMGGVEPTSSATRPAGRDELPRRRRRPPASTGSSTSAGSGATTIRASRPTCAAATRSGDVLADGPVPVTELRAAVIIGSGSASFEMLRYLVEVLPVMVTPRWVAHPVPADRHPRRAALPRRPCSTAEAAGRVLEVGGPDVLTYREMMAPTPRWPACGTRSILPVPVLTPQPVVALGRAGHPAARRPRPAAGRQPESTRWSCEDTADRAT